LIDVEKRVRYQTPASASQRLRAADLMNRVLPHRHQYIRMPGKTGLTLLDEWRQLGLTLPVIIMTGHGNICVCQPTVESSRLNESRIAASSSINQMYCSITSPRNLAELTGCMLLDIRMPGKTGLTLLDEWRQLGLTRLRAADLMNRVLPHRHQLTRCTAPLLLLIAQRKPRLYAAGYPHAGENRADAAR
jgi:CheY-like chemotaxis protein